MNNKFSIIIPAYNEANFIADCLDSILAVDYPREKIEIIVIDNGSTDRTRDIVKSCNVKLLRDDNLTVSGLRNLGVEHASGDILAFVDADCIVTVSWLKFASVYCNQANVAAWGAPPEIPERATWVQQTWFIIRQKEYDIQEVDWLESMNFFVRKKDFNY